MPKDFSSRLDILKMSVAYQNPALEEDFEEGVDPMTTQEEMVRTMQGQVRISWSAPLWLACRDISKWFDQICCYIPKYI